MTVVKFPLALRGDDAHEWQTREIKTVIGAAAGSVLRGDVSGWDVGRTEAGDPQLYLLGPGPKYDCVLCVSRLGRTYVIEDGDGRIVFEHDAMTALADQVRDVLSHKKAAIVARATLAWISVKTAFEEKVEPLLAEPMEVLTHIAPQLAAVV